MADVTIDGLNQVLRAVSRFPKMAGNELRDEAQSIASNVMAPSYSRSAGFVPHWGGALQSGIRAKRDRIPSVAIGYKRAAVSGGASSVMLRYPTTSGQKRESWAPFQETDWIKRAQGYKGEAMRQWTQALERVVRKWNRGGPV